MLVKYKHILKSNARKDVQFIAKIICPHLDYKRISVSFVNSVLIKFRRKNSFSQSRRTREKSAFLFGETLLLTTSVSTILSLKVFVLSEVTVTCGLPR